MIRYLGRKLDLEYPSYLMHYFLLSQTFHLWIIETLLIIGLRMTFLREIEGRRFSLKLVPTLDTLIITLMILHGPNFKCKLLVLKL